MHDYQESNVFAGKHGFITPRDLFRWAGRGAVGYQALAEAGFMVLGERLRAEEERSTVLTVLNKLLKANVRLLHIAVHWSLHTLVLVHDLMTT